MFWQTPRVGVHGQPGKHRGNADSLGEQVQLWATPNAKASEDSQTHRSGSRSGELLLTGQAQAFPSFLPAPSNTSDGQPSSQSVPTSRPRLNPLFVSWLMGVPPFWVSPYELTPSELTPSEHSETEWFLSALQRRFESSWRGSTNDITG